MTVIEKVLLRKDMAAIAVAVVVGLATAQLLTLTTSPILSSAVVGADAYRFKEDFVLPVIAFAVQVVALEGLLRLVIAARARRVTVTKTK